MVTVSDQVSDRDGVDLVTGIEQFTFSDGTVALADIAGGGSTEDPAPDPDPPPIVPTQGADSLTGTSGNDVINALGGNDVILGAGGSDIMLGALGDDYLVGGAGHDQMMGDLGGPADGPENVAAAYMGNDTLHGGAGIDTLRGEYGDDELDGGADGDKLSGGWGSDLLTGGGGNDTINGGGGEDVAFFTGARGQYLVTLSGDMVTVSDQVSDRDGVDLVTGIEQFTFSDGTVALADIADALDGDTADFLPNGGAGDDLFVFEKGDGVDQISQFSPGVGLEDIGDLAGNTEISGVENVQSVVSPVSADTIIDSGSGDSVQLLGVDTGGLHQDDFLF